MTTLVSLGAMPRLLLIAALLLAAPVVFAHQPVFPTPEAYSDYTEITDATVARAYYGVLDGYPHTYQVVTEGQPLDFSVEIMVPDIDEVKNNRSVIIVKEEVRGVSEVARLRAQASAWDSVREPWGGDTYRQGSSYRGELTPGTYLIEVSTPDNVGQYVLSVGTKEQFNVFGYFKAVQDMYQVKKFFGKSDWRIIESRLVYGPLLGIIFVIILLLYLKKRRRHA